MRTTTMLAAVGGILSGGLIATGVTVMTAPLPTTVTASPVAESVVNLWEPPARAPWMHTRCAEEDSFNCAWNAHMQGNWRGHSFYRVKRHLVGPYGHNRGKVICVFYVKGTDIHAWDACHIIPRGQDGHFG